MPSLHNINNLKLLTENTIVSQAELYKYDADEIGPLYTILVYTKVTLKISISKIVVWGFGGGYF